MAVSITSIPIVAVSTLAIVVLVLLILISKQRRRISALTSSKDGISLESVIVNLIAKVDEIEKTLAIHREALGAVDARVKKSIRGYSLVKYNAYSDNGGEQSFASGLIDENQDGYVLSVIQNRSHVGIYAKNVVNGNSDTSLTEEEIQALEKAKKSL